MYTPSLIFLGQIIDHRVTDRQRDLIVEAEKYRLLAASRRRRRRAAADAPEARERTVGTLAGCGPSAAAPAR
jgi:hypothetical protein